MNDEQIFVGINNDSANFVIDGNQHTCSDFQMVSPWLEIQNGRVTDSECSGIATTADTQSKNFPIAFTYLIPLIQIQFI